MKKLMIAAAFICAAALSQAASVNWGGAIADPSYATSGEAMALPSTAYLVWAASDLGTSASFDTETGLTDTGFELVDQYTITDSDANDAWAFGKEYFKAGKDVNGYYQVLVTNADGDMASIYSFSVAGTTATSSVVDKQLNPSWDSDDFLQMGGYTVTVGGGPGPEPVPEPTSGLLLLLGMAGLALKRKCA